MPYFKFSPIHQKLLNQQIFTDLVLRYHCCIVIQEVKGVLHPLPILWMFIYLSQKLQHIGIM